MRFLAIGVGDGRFIRTPGLFGFVRRDADDDRILLYADHADQIAQVATSAHRLWPDALRLGMNELHICLSARERLDRLQLRHHLIKRTMPILNVTAESHGAAPSAGGFAKSFSSRA